MKRLKYIIPILLVLLTLTACANTKVDKIKTKQNTEKPAFEDTPTLYFHGLMGSHKNEIPFAKAAKKSGMTNSVTRAHVDKKGKVKLIGKIGKKAKNPIIEVDFEDNVQPSFKRNGEYATNVVKALQKKYHIKTVNMIGYSLGNMAIIHYMMQNGDKKSMPQLKKQVSIGGHFDGAYFKELPPGFRQPKNVKLDHNGKPNKMNQTYKEMLAVRPLYREHHVEVLNVIGNIGNNSDGVVETVSAKSLKYLIADSPYHEFQVNSDHGSLPGNKEVNTKIIKFLWR